MLKKFSSKDLIIVAVLAAIGIAIKPLITPTIKMISAPLLIPGGSLAGGFYMMWLVLAVVLVPKWGSGLLFGFVQAIVTFVLGWFGNHGVLSLISYTLPGLVTDFVCLLPLKPGSLFQFAILGAVANLTGSMIMAVVIFSLPLIPLMISALTAVVSGILGGLIAFYISKKIRSYGL